MVSSDRDTAILIARAGPVGSTVAVELARRGVDVRIGDPLPSPPAVHESR